MFEFKNAQVFSPVHIPGEDHMQIQPPEDATADQNDTLLPGREIPRRVGPQQEPGQRSVPEPAPAGPDFIEVPNDEASVPPSVDHPPVPPQWVYPTAPVAHPPVPANAQDLMSEARAAGHSWDDINTALAEHQQNAMDQGWSQRDIADRMGYQADNGLADRLGATAARDKALGQQVELKAGDAIPAAIRGAYADALMTGETTGPDHFAGLYNAAHPAIEDLPAQLPSHEDFTDHSIGITQDAGLPLTADFLAQTKMNLMDAWAETGLTPHDLYVRALHDANLSDALTTPQPPPPAPVEAPPAEKGFFDPLINAAKAVGNFIKSIDQATAPAGIGELADVIGGAGKAIGEDIGTLASPIIEAAKIPGEVYLHGEAGSPEMEGQAREFASVFGALKPTVPAGALSAGLDIAGSIKGQFRTPTQMAADAAKGEAKEFVQGTVREQTGLARQQIAQASNQLEEFRGQINKALPEFQDWTALDATGRAGQPRPMIANILGHMEGVPGGPRIDPASPFAPVADALRDIYTDIKSDIETNHPDMLNAFHEDYYRYLWSDPRQADKLLGPARMGSTAPGSLPGIATISKGLDMGLTPKVLDPIDNAVHFISGMRNFVAQQETLRLGLDHDYVKYSATGAPEDGWTALKGRSSEKNFIAQDAEGNDVASTMRAYAAPGFAGSYNNWVGKGFYEYPTLGKIYDGLQYTANMLTGLKLGMSGFHAFNIAQETAIAGFANTINGAAHGIGDAARGDFASSMSEFGQAIGQAAPSIPVLPKVGMQLYKGDKFTSQYLGIKDYGPEMQQLTDLYAAAGGRATGGGQGLIGQDNAMGRSFNVWNPTKWLQDSKGIGSAFKEAARDNPDSTNLVSGLLKAGRVSLAVPATVGHLMSGLVAPMFEEAIPRIKNAAFADEMSAWLQRNPNATRDVQLGVARKLVDSMDDRFGELVQDNLFWPKMVKQSLNLATISIGWEYGTIRAFGGAAGDILKGAGGLATGDMGAAAEGLLSTRARWLYSLPVTMGIMGSAYQYMKTGQLPTQTNTPFLDLVAPRTGGTVPSGAGSYPERAQTPGYQKDAEQWHTLMMNTPSWQQYPAALLGQAFNKLNPLWRLGYGAVTDKNPFFGTILNEHPGLEGWKDYAKWVGEELSPIVFGQDRKRGTNITMGEQIAGLHPIGQAIANADAAKSFQQILLEREQTNALKARAAREKNFETPPENPTVVPTPVKKAPDLMPNGQPVPAAPQKFRNSNPNPVMGPQIPDELKPQPQQGPPIPMGHFTKAQLAPMPRAPAPPRAFDVPGEESDGPPMPPEMMPARPAPAPSSGRAHTGANHYYKNPDGTSRP